MCARTRSHPLIAFGIRATISQKKDISFPWSTIFCSYFCRHRCLCCSLCVLCVSFSFTLFWPFSLVLPRSAFSAADAAAASCLLSSARKYSDIHTYARICRRWMVLCTEDTANNIFYILCKIFRCVSFFLPRSLALARLVWTKPNKREPSKRRNQQEKQKKKNEDGIFSPKWAKTKHPTSITKNCAQHNELRQQKKKISRFLVP